MMNKFMNLLGYEKRTEEVKKEADPSTSAGFFSTHIPFKPGRATGGNVAYDATHLDERAFLRTPASLMARDGSKAIAMDDLLDSGQGIKNLYSLGQQFVPEPLFSWYVAQSFIGYQACALMAQQWLINKACMMPAADAVRNGFNVTSNVGKEIDIEVMARIRKANERYSLAKHLKNAVYFNRVFGIRHILFLVDGVNTEAPFNIDGVKKGSYRGMVQIDPYWITPELDKDGVAGPATEHFYEPTWWRVAGKRYHRSHFVILKGPEVSDILKPSYLYGGISLTQRIFERVYAAERTANETPQLVLTKRLLTFKTDMAQALANQAEFEQNMEKLTILRDNYGVVLHGLEEEIGQRDTNLTHLDQSIETQYALVAAEAGIPATKLMGTSPEGFQSTGDHEDQSYREALETLQAEQLTPIVNRHTELMMRSGEIEGLTGSFEDYEITWKPTSVPTMKELADRNYTLANTDSLLRTAGAISPQDVRGRIIGDPLSGYDGISIDDMPKEGFPPPATGSANEDKSENPKGSKINAPQRNTSTARATSGAKRK